MALSYSILCLSQALISDPNKRSFSKNLKKYSKNAADKQGEIFDAWSPHYAIREDVCAYKAASLSVRKEEI